MAHDVTALLQDLRGDDRLVDAILPLVYDELRAIAHRQLRREWSAPTLSTTALVHEAYVRLVDQTCVGWEDRAHFYAVAARAMRRILIDRARRRSALKRGGSARPLSLDEAQVAVDEQADLLLSIDDALTRLGALRERLAQVVEMRFFGGMTEEETAEALGLSVRTVRRDWVTARAWLYKELYPDDGTSGGP